jgi:hypothetical protein
MEEEKLIPEKLTSEEIVKKQQEELKALQEKITRVGKEIGEILQKEELMLIVDQVIRIVPQRR